MSSCGKTCFSEKGKQEVLVFYQLADKLILVFVLLSTYFSFYLFDQFYKIIQDNHCSSPPDQGRNRESLDGCSNFYFEIHSESNSAPGAPMHREN